MSKVDERILAQLAESGKIEGKITKIFCEKEDKVDALVRVRNPLHLGILERKFNVTAMYPFIRSLRIECGLKEAIMLEKMQEVEYVFAQSKVLALVDVEPQNNFQSIQNTHSNSMFSPIPTFCDGLDGEGVTLCVMDTGISLHSDLSMPKERIIHFVDMINGGEYPYDDNGHGTFVTGVAIGNGMLSGRRVIGVAPKANVVGIKVIGESGESGTFKILDGMQWLFDNYRRYGIRVVCMSFGAEPLQYADPLKMGVEMLVRSGLIVVVASGNSGENSLKSPAISSEVIAVGAVNNEDRISDFSSRGVYNGVLRPDVYAEGVNVKGIKAGGGYCVMSGTSVSAPYVAGACCLLCQKYRNITPYQAKIAIMHSSENVDGALVFRL